MIDMSVYWDITKTSLKRVKDKFPSCFYEDEWKQRMIWAPGFPRDQERSLDKNWSQFFDGHKKYLRIKNTKYEVDPDRIFTPNPYCVGYYPMAINPSEDEKKMSSEEVQDEFKSESTLSTKKTKITKQNHCGDRGSALSEMKTTAIREIGLTSAVNLD